jgi:hypothetical protein
VRPHARAWGLCRTDATKSHGMRVHVRRFRTVRGGSAGRRGQARGSRRGRPAIADSAKSVAGQGLLRARPWQSHSTLRRQGAQGLIVALAFAALPVWISGHPSASHSQSPDGHPHARGEQVAYSATTTPQVPHLGSDLEHDEPPDPPDLADPPKPMVAPPDSPSSTLGPADGVVELVITA